MNRIERDSFVWNMLGSLLNAFQSVFFLMVLTRTIGLAGAGIFTIAYADANLFLNIGKYGMRYYQVSDVEERFSFPVYRGSRILTTVLMVVISALYVWIAGDRAAYSPYKSGVILWMCLFKSIDAIEDVYHGEWQRCGRLDIAGKAMTVRMALTILVFIVCVVITGDLLRAVIFSTAAATVLLIILTITGHRTVDRYMGSRHIPTAHGAPSDTRIGICQLFVQCLPLFLGSFLSFYIGNAPKYAIDTALTDELQAIYGFLSMPVFVVGLLNSFIFNPVIGRLSTQWHEGRVRDFLRQSARQILWLLAITLVCIVGAWAIGIPVLSLLYSTDLDGYLPELLILLLGGGLLGLSGLLSTLITIIRQQNSLMVGYILISVAAFLCSGRVVASGGLMGASVLYTALMAGLCIAFAVCLWIGIGTRVKYYDKEKSDEN